MSNVKSIKLKYTLNDPARMDNIIEAFTDVYTRRSAVLKGKNGEVDFGSTLISKKHTEFFEGEGIKVIRTVNTYHKGKEVIDKMPVEVVAKNPQSYKREGVVITIIASGVTEEDLQNDIDRKERKLLQYMTKHRIPADRLCAESLLKCKYKFSNQVCETA